jgi:hypothetical protein
MLTEPRILSIACKICSSNVPEPRIIRPKSCAKRSDPRAVDVEKDSHMYVHHVRPHSTSLAVEGTLVINFNKIPPHKYSTTGMHYDQREARTFPSPFTVLCIPSVSILAIRQVTAKLFIEPEQRELAPLEFLPGATSASPNTTPGINPPLSAK